MNGVARTESPSFAEPASPTTGCGKRIGFAVRLALDRVGAGILFIDREVAEQPFPALAGVSVDLARRVPLVEPGGRLAVAEIVGAADELAGAAFVPEGAVGAAAGHQNGRAVLHRHAEDARRRVCLLQGVANGRARKFAGDAAKPLPPTVVCTGSPTTFSSPAMRSSYHSFETIPEVSACRPESSTECPGPVSVFGVAVVGVGEDRTLVEQTLEPGLVERREPLQILRFHLVHGNEQDQSGFGRRRRGNRAAGRLAAR